MAKRPISSRNGAIVLPSGFAADFQALRLHEYQARRDITPFGSNKYATEMGSGTPKLEFSCSGFAVQGAVSTNPGFGAMSGANGDVGAAATITLDTGNTVTGNFLVYDIELAESRIEAGAPVSFQLVNTGDPTFTWPTT